MSYGFYFLSGFLFISGVLLLASTEDTNSLLGGAILIMLAFGLTYMGGKVDDWTKFNTGGTLGTTPRPME